ncbi:VWA domain-containing protein [Arachnia rubra]|uniref:VWA domain-containing protein n=1 Tax=Arachnia rubra TaxID=1547448 RepID=A0ABX7Y2B9_9ACTN|nr:VWA domain-containing protein [Arachnia rubra]MBB1571749.1 VWA domain-containing protein [Propionibacterium sp.]MBB1575751.1 VWA domain-containing protein [Propionibacterium sp.]MDO4644425.1 VWA domain-containing protein [Propionibacteriaceae bacterium]QUC06928.1 VWA domain-containing protein [Arachnia rubra]
MATMTTLILEFMQSARLWALILIPAIAGVYWYLARRIPQSRKPGSRSRIQLVIPKDAAWKRHGAVLLALLSLASLVIAWATPKDYGKQPRDRATVVVTIDVSWSMEAEDVKPNRLETAKQAAKKFISSLPERFNVALVTFAGTANVNVPPTVDRGVLTRAIDNLEMAPSTAIGEAIYTSLDALKQVPPDPDHPDETAPAAIVLLSDGASNLGRSSAAAAEQSKEMGVPIYTIAYGTQDGFVESNGERQRVAVDHHELYVIAERSGGKKFSAESADQLSEIYQAISSDVGYEKVPMEITDQYAGLAIIFAILAAVGVISLGARWP